MENPKSAQTSRRQAIVGVNLLRLITFLTAVPVIGVIVYIIVRGAPALSWEFFTAMPRDGMRAGGIMPAIVGTFYLTLGTAIFSVPLGVAAGIYISEYAPDNRLTRLVRIAIINLAGIPSVVYGLFGLGLFVLFLKFGTSILAASLTLSIMTLPVIISTTEEALRQVPSSFRVVSTSLGATRWQTVQQDHPAASHAGRGDRHHFGSGTGGGRDGTDHVYRCLLLPAAAAPVTNGCDHGAAVSYFRHFHSGAGHAGSNSIRHCFGAD